ncbi:MFS transporter [Streptomyces avicenniae]|uniref:MFS transporter n=1 Tax=Streptomyces avicenniae TaxID=500153 RepID=UPI00069BD425|nr:MFS transporter [Streptomyces avicenniae]
MGTSAAGLRAYREIFRIPGAGSFVAASLVGRLPLAMLSLATVFLVEAETGSYATAGAVASAGALCYALVVPRLGRAADRLGQRRVLRPLALAFGATGALFVLAAQLDGPHWTLYAAGAAFMAVMPPVGALTRARWSHLAGSDGALVTSSYSFESVAEELIFVVGPLLVSAVVLLDPAAGVAAVAVAGTAGGLLLAAQRRTEPPAVPRPAGGGGSALAVHGLRLMCAVYVCVAAMIACWELSTLAFVDAHGSPWMVGGVMAAYAVGSGVGGLWYGARQWETPLDRRFLLALAAVVLGMGPLWAMPGVTALWVFSLFSGLLVAPTVIAGYGLVRQGVPPAALTEGMTWLSTAIGVGKAGGVLGAGVLIDTYGPRWGYALTLACGLVGLAVGLLGTRHLRAMAAARHVRAA